MSRKIGLAILFQVIGLVFLVLISCDLNPLWFLTPYWIGKTASYVFCAVGLFFSVFFEVGWRKEIGGYYPKAACILSFCYSLCLSVLFYFWYFMSFDMLGGLLPLCLYIAIELGLSCYLFTFLRPKEKKA